MTPSSTNGSRTYQFAAPTSFMIAVCSRRANAATRIVFAISTPAASSWISAMMSAPLRTRVVNRRNWLSTSRWSTISSTPGYAENWSLMTPNSCGFSSLTRNEAGSVETSIASMSVGWSANRRVKRS